MRSLTSLITSVFLLFAFATTEASWINHGKGLFHINSALSQNKSTLRLSSHSCSFFKDEVNTRPDGTASGVTYWDVQGGLGFRYGLSNRFELGLTQIVYQDNHKVEPGWNIPDDLFLTAKLGSLGAPNSNYRLGLQLNSRIPLAEYHNVPFEAYSAGRIELGVMGLITFVSDPLFPNYGVNVHLNTGFLTHNDFGTRLTDSELDTITTGKSSQEFLYGVGISKRGREFGFFMEVYGRNFIQQPPVTAYTRENCIYIMPGLTYDPNSWLSVLVGLDIRLSGDKDETDYNSVRKIGNHLPNLPSWRIHFGASITLIPKKLQQTTQYRPLEASATSVSTDDTQLYKALADERRKTEDAEQELERIRTERKRMEQMLERLRRILEWPSQSEQSKKSNSKSTSSSQ
jgi:hypothetical protein